MKYILKIFKYKCLLPSTSRGVMNMCLFFLKILWQRLNSEIQPRRHCKVQLQFGKLIRNNYYKDVRILYLLERAPRRFLKGLGGGGRGHLFKAYLRKTMQLCNIFVSFFLYQKTITTACEEHKVLKFFLSPLSISVSFQ